MDAIIPMITNVINTSESVKDFLLKNPPPPC